MEKKKEYPWLTSRNKKLGCRTCNHVKSLGPYKSKGTQLSKEWTSFLVTAYGTDKEKQCTSLRKKIFKHKNSSAHQSAEKMQEEAGMESLKTCLEKETDEYFKTTSRIFKTAYKNAKCESPFINFQQDVDLQKLNGLNMGRILQSPSICADITMHISTEMRKKICSSIISSDRKLAVLVDESTGVGSTTCLVVCMRTVLGDTNEPVTFFLDLIELTRTTSAAIYDHLITCLRKRGFTEDFLRSNLVWFATDGASNMIGRKSGVAVLLKQLVPL